MEEKKAKLIFNMGVARSLLRKNAKVIDVRWLKSERKEADYTQRDFNQKESLECIDKAKGIICKLNQYFGL